MKLFDPTKLISSYDVAHGSEIMPCKTINKI